MALVKRNTSQEDLEAIVRRLRGVPSPAPSSQPPPTIPLIQSPGLLMDDFGVAPAITAPPTGDRVANSVLKQGTVSATDNVGVIEDDASQQPAPQPQPKPQQPGSNPIQDVASAVIGNQIVDAAGGVLGGAPPIPTPPPTFPGAPTFPGSIGPTGPAATAGQGILGNAAGIGGLINAASELSQFGQSTEDTVEGITTALGTAGGYFVGGPFGAAIGSALGDLYGDNLGNVAAGDADFTDHAISFAVSPLAWAAAFGNSLFGDKRNPREENRHQIRQSVFEQLGGEYVPGVGGRDIRFQHSELDPENNPLHAQAIGLADPIAEAFFPGDEKKRQDMSALISNMIASTAGNAGDLEENLLSFIREMGITAKDVRAAIKKSNIDEERRRVYALNMSKLTGNSFERELELIGGKSDA